MFKDVTKTSPHPAQLQQVLFSQHEVFQISLSCRVEFVVGLTGLQWDGRSALSLETSVLGGASTSPQLQCSQASVSRLLIATQLAGSILCAPPPQSMRC